LTTSIAYLALIQSTLGGHDRITGFQSGRGVRKELRVARALVLPSSAEGLPVVIVEAMTLGRPVISTYAAGMPDLVEPGRSGWLVPAGVVESLTEILTADPAELERMGQAGTARTAEQNGIGTEVRKLAALFADANPSGRHEPHPNAVAAR